jgi:hypothetical protein
MARKRAPGGGRKPKDRYGGRASPLSIRMTDEMRARLEASARHRKGGISLSEEILFRIRSSIDRERDEKRDPASRALCYLLAETIAAVASVTAGPNWRSDPYAFQSIKLAFSLVLDDVRPPGEIRAHAMQEDKPYAGTWVDPSTLKFRLTGGTPEEMAHFIHGVILMQQLRPLDEEQAENRSREQEDFAYDMSHALRNLQLKEPNQ